MNVKCSCCNGEINGPSVINCPCCNALVCDRCAENNAMLCPYCSTQLFYNN
ncbi:MAG: hypothetical protein J6Z34_03275 [Clostridia bacterium]|nr:hypothetical protein [Clostridia bacterium]